MCSRHLNGRFPFFFSPLKNRQVVTYLLLQSSAPSGEDKSKQQEATPSKSQENDGNEASCEQAECCVPENHHLHRSETPQEAAGHTSASGSQGEDVIMSDAEIFSQAESVKLCFVERTGNYGIPQLERLYTRIMKGVFEAKDSRAGDDPKLSILKFLMKFANDEANF